MDRSGPSKREIWHRRLHTISLYGTILILPFQMMAFNVFGYDLLDNIPWNLSRLFPVIEAIRPLFHIIWAVFYLLGPSLIMIYFSNIVRKHKITLMVILVLIIFPASIFAGLLTRMATHQNIVFKPDNWIQSN